MDAIPVLVFLVGIVVVVLFRDAERRKQATLEASGSAYWVMRGDKPSTSTTDGGDGADGGGGVMTPQISNWRYVND